MEPIFHNILVKDILQPLKPILRVNSRERVGNLLNYLKQTKLRCCVVYDTENLFVGFVDATDIASYVIESTKSEDLEDLSFSELYWEGQSFFFKPSGVLQNASSRNQMITISPTDTLSTAIRLFAEGFHRLAVVEGGNILNIISQSDIIRLLVARIRLLGTKAFQTLEDAGLVTHNVEVITEGNSVIEALKFLKKKQLNGAPVIDDTGRMTYNFSTTDILPLNVDSFAWISLPVVEYLYKVYGTPKPPVICYPRDTLETLLLKFHAYGVHRVYLVDDNFMPTGVISATDVMIMLMSPEEVM